MRVKPLAGGVPYVVSNASAIGPRGLRTPRGNRIDKKYIYRMLSNRAYIDDPSRTKKGARRYQYYVSMDVIKNREPSDEGIPRRLPADLVEAAVVTELRRVMRAPSITAQVIAHLAREGHAFAEADVISALQTFDDVWGQLFPAERTRIVQLLVRRVTVTSGGLVIDVRTDGVSGVMRDMMAPRKKVAAE
ncbi:site-specific recombinase [Cereibacter sphaeroides f. sp. denitrificans]